MRDILNGPNYLSRSLPALPHSRQAMERLRFDLDKVLNYRRNLGRRVDANHLLVRLLGSLNVPLHLPDMGYVWAVDDQALKLAASLKLTSPFGPGGVHAPGILYGEEIHEVWIATIEPFDPAQARKVWEDLQPIRLVSHPYNDFTFPYLDGSGDGVVGSGMAVVMVNISLLAFQHKCWWERYVSGNPDSPPGLNQFLANYPLTNALASHLDLTLANRFMAQAVGTPLTAQRDPNPFYISFQTDVVDRTLAEALAYVDKRSLSFDDVLSAMPMAVAKDVHQWLGLPELAFTTQMEWAAFMARLPLMGFLLAYNAKQGSAFNQPYVNAIRHWVRRMRSGRLFGHGLRREGQMDVERTIAQTIEPFI